MPKLQQMRSGLDIKVCILWNMDRPIPKFMDLNRKCFGAFHQELAFASLANACYKCRKVGHYSRNCPMAMVVSNPMVKTTWKHVNRDAKLATVENAGRMYVPRLMLRM
ncbi:hypothetical protein GOP47_0020330 [Adiantum capillus-veneris]|uniref:CCHC-type domain-containing protein n=1 Tax=Adiantum capillus-veneris TaxID=13818 RepID=A0A9D4Z9D0_ADICA|nr:hypothetical protein GOP47_0020330 [Adiantum capillus-veneris]